ncbi:MAG: SBBP repeat-containing protein, partial [Candidatus Kariarchaeaceae archaeon]
MLNKMEPKEKRILQAIVLSLIGTIIIAYNLIPLFYMMGLPITPGTVRMINYWILGIAFILSGIFTLKPRRTRKGIIVLGSISTVMGGILLLSTMQIIVEIIVKFGGTPLIYIFWNDIPSLATFMISGTVLLLHGLILIITKRKNMKLIWGVTFASIGITVVVWVSYPLYMSIISSTLSPFFSVAIYLNLIIIGVSLLLNGFFYFNPPEKRRIKLIDGMISIIFGGVIVIFSLFGILSFNMYVEGLDSEGPALSLMDLNSIFVIFILLGVGLIIHGANKIKKNLDMRLITLVRKKKKILIGISFLISLITFFTIFLSFSLDAPKRIITSLPSSFNINSFELNKTWGGSSNEEVDGIALDSSGNIYITGTIDIYGGEGDDNIFLLKYDSAGNLLWYKTWGQSDYDYCSGIAIDSSGNAFITGKTYNYGKAYSDIFILKYDSSGKRLWKRTWGGSDDEWAPEIALDASGNAFISGSTESYGTGNPDAFILKLDSSGNKLWAKTWGASERDLGMGIALDDLGNPVIMGQTLSYGSGYDDVFLLKYNSSGNLLWNNTWGGVDPEYVNGMVLDVSGNTCITGQTWSYGAGPADVFLLKYDSAGNLLWDKTWGGSSGESGREIAVDASGNMYITGETPSYGAGHEDAFLLKYDSSGNLLWAKTWGGSENDYGRGIVLDASGNTFIAGSIGVYSGTGHSDVFLLKYDSVGNLLWAKTWGGSTYDHCRGIVLDSSGNTFIAGVTGNYGAESDFDVFLLKHELDTDSDGLSDNNENFTYFTDSNNSDTDSDGLSDGWEVNYGLNPTWSSDASIDGDNDGLTNLEEYQYKADPTNSDTDGDELSDGDEVNKYHTDPTNSDTDGDQYSDDQEIQMGTDPLSSLSNLTITLTIIIVIALTVGVPSLIFISKYY